MPRFITCAAVLCLIVSGLPAAAAPVTLVSRADPDRLSVTPGGESEIAAVSADARYVVFRSVAGNLVPGLTDTNLGPDLFFHDRLAGTTVLISHAASDLLTTGNHGAARSAAISADGRWVVFGSHSTDLVAGQVDAEDTRDVFLWDRNTGLTTLVSHQAGLPTTAAGECWNEASISADGSRIAFASLATTFVAGQSDSAGTFDVFLYDRAGGTNSLVSHVSGSATTAAGGSAASALSADGSWVAFESWGVGLVAGQIDTPQPGFDVFLHETATGTNVLVSRAAGTAATTGNGESRMPRISADGSRIAYVSFAGNLVAGVADGNGSSDVFLYDRAAGVSTLVSHASSSAMIPANDNSFEPVLSADGRHVAFLSVATDLVPGIASSWSEIYVYDRTTGTNLLVSRDPMKPSDQPSFYPRISADGAWIAFLSYATNLVPGQVDRAPSSRDVFLWSRASGSRTLVTRTPESATTAAGGEALDLQISADGSRIVLESTSAHLVAGLADYNVARDLFVYERATGTHSLVTARGGAASASASGDLEITSRPVMSNDGRYLTFNSAASNFSGVTSDGNYTSDVFLADRVTGAVALVSHASGSPTTAADGFSSGAVVSADGTAVLFASYASNLLSPPVSEAGGELYLYDRTTGEITLVSHAAGFPSVPADGAFGGIGQYSVSGDGRWIAFVHTGADLIPGQVDGNLDGVDVFLFDRATGTNTLVSHASSSPAQTGNRSSHTPSISADGRYVAFVSGAFDLVPGFGAGIYLYDRVAGTTTRVSPGGIPTLSADGRWILFSSNETNVVPGQVDTNFTDDVFLWDRISGSTVLVSHTPGSPTTTGNGWSHLNSLFGFNAASALSADGRWAVFHSTSTDLVSGQTGDPDGVFLFDRITGAVTLVSRSAASPAVNREAFNQAISADGRFVSFGSPANDLVPGQMTSGQNYFLYDRIAGTTALVAHIPSSEVTSGGEWTPIGLLPANISADGAWVAFTSRRTDLVAGDYNGDRDAFLHGQPFGRDFFTLPPCRILDTRLAGQGPALASGLKRTLAAHGSCGIPEMARALAVNVTVVQPSAAGYLTFHAGDLAAETASTINFSSGQLRSNNAVLPLSFDGRGLLAVTPSVGGSGTVHLIVDVSGWFE